MTEGEQIALWIGGGIFLIAITIIIYLIVKHMMDKTTKEWIGADSVFCKASPSSIPDIPNTEGIYFDDMLNHCQDIAQNAYSPASERVTCFNIKNDGLCTFRKGCPPSSTCSTDTSWTNYQK